MVKTKWTWNGFAQIFCADPDGNLIELNVDQKDLDEKGFKGKLPENPFFYANCGQETSLFARIWFTETKGRNVQNKPDR